MLSIIYIRSNKDGIRQIYNLENERDFQPWIIKAPILKKLSPTQIKADYTYDLS